MLADVQREQGKAVPVGVRGTSSVIQRYVYQFTNPYLDLSFGFHRAAASSVPPAPSPAPLLPSTVHSDPVAV